MNASMRKLPAPDLRMHFCTRSKGERITAIGPNAKDTYATVPMCLASVVQVHLNMDTELPSSFSGVKYHCAKDNDKLSCPKVRMNDDVQIRLKTINQNLHESKVELR